MFAGVRTCDLMMADADSDEHKEAEEETQESQSSPRATTTVREVGPQLLTESSHFCQQ